MSRVLACERSGSRLCKKSSKKCQRSHRRKLFAIFLLPIDLDLKTNQDQQRVKTPRSFYAASVELTRSPHRPRSTAICAKRPDGVDVSRTSRIAENRAKVASGGTKVALEWADLQTSVHRAEACAERRSLQQFPSANSGALAPGPKFSCRRGADVHGNGDFNHQSSD